MSGTGTFGLAALRREYPNPMLDRVSGNLDWSLKVDVLAPGKLAWVFESNLKGAAVDLPAPLGKTAAEEVPLRVEGRDEASPPGTDFILAAYGRVAQLAAHRQQSSGGASIDRALLSLGSAIDRPDAARAERPGLWVRGEIPALNVDDWIAVLPRLGVSRIRAAESRAFARRCRLRCPSVRCDGSALHRSQVAMRGKCPKGWAFDLDGPRDRRDGELVARRARARRTAGSSRGSLASRCPAGATSRRGEAPTRRKAAAMAHSDALAANPWPEIDLAADAFISKERDLGRLEFVAQPKGADWKIDRLRLANDAGQLDASGGVACRGARAADEARRRPRRQGCRCVPCTLRLCRGAEGRADADRGTARVVRRAARVRLQHAERQFQHPASGRDASRSSNPAPASSWACCRCRRCRDGSRSTTATSSATASRSTRSPAT